MKRADLERIVANVEERFFSDPCCYWCAEIGCKCPETEEIQYLLDASNRLLQMTDDQLRVRITG